MILARDAANKEETLLIEKKLLEGVVARTSTLFFTWAFISTLYGFLSLELFQRKIPGLTLWDNVWPRFFLSSLPLIFAALIYRRNNHFTKIKVYLTIVLMPLFLMMASMIMAWPLFWGGHYDFYLQFHATNIIAMASGIFVISASPRMILAQCAGFILIYFGPLIILFSQFRSELAQIICSDSLMISIILFITLKSIYQLRVSLAIDDNQRRKKASLFLGKKLTDVIYNSSSMIHDDYTRDGLIMSVDLRGYTRFTQSTDTETVRLFMSEYYSLMTKVVTSNGSYLHKTSGDGFLISIGVMDNEVDLSDLPHQEDKFDTEKTKANSLRHAFEVFTKMAQGLEVLSAKYNFSNPLVLGAGCAFGAIEVLVRGDDSSRLELDIQGNSIIKSVRLEAYSKLLNQNIDNESSFLLLAPELTTSAHPSQSFKTLMVTGDNKVRDYPEIDLILYRQWKHKRGHGSGIKAA